MNPLFYSMFIEPNLNDTDALFMGAVFLLLIIVGVIMWVYDLIKEHNDSVQ